MAEGIQLLIVHRNRLFRECLASVLNESGDLDVSELDHADPEHRQRLKADPANVLLVDSSLPDAPADLIRHVQTHAPRTKIVLLVHAVSQDNLMECIAAGVHGCILEDASLGQLRSGIERVMAGESFCSPELVHVLFERLSQTSRRSRWQMHAKSVGLTPRELEIVYLISRRLSNKQIAKRLSVSLYTIKNHVHNIIEKLQVSDRFAAVEYAQQQRWLPQRRKAETIEPI
jgi:DNA-binding NarL/FixJ family response regulator